MVALFSIIVCMQLARLITSGSLRGLDRNASFQISWSTSDVEADLGISCREHSHPVFDTDLDRA